MDVEEFLCGLAGLERIPFAYRGKRSAAIKPCSNLRLDLALERERKRERARVVTRESELSEGGGGGAQVVLARVPLGGLLERGGGGA